MMMTTMMMVIGNSSAAVDRAYDLSVLSGATAVGGGQRRRACLRVPRNLAVLGGAADRQRVNAVRVAVAVAAVAVLAAVARRPDEYRAETGATLQSARHRMGRGNRSVLA